MSGVKIQGAEINLRVPVLLEVTEIELEVTNE